MTKLTNIEEQARIEAIKKRGSISAFDCMFHSSQFAKKQNEQAPITAKKPAQIASQPKSKKPYLPASVKKALLAADKMSE